MIQQIHFDGYRLLDGFEADLGPLTVVVGANATGKSSLLEALSLVTHGVDWPIEDVVAFRNGMWSIVNCARDCDEIGWKLTFSKPVDHPLWSRIPIADNTPCVYEARLWREPEGKVVPRYECLRYANPPRNHKVPFKMLEVERQRARVYDPMTGRLTPFDQPQPSSSSITVITPGLPLESPVQKASLVLAQMRFEHQFPIPTWVRGYLSSFCYYPGFDVSRTSPVRTKAAEIRAHTGLAPTGENLGTVLHEILTRHDFRDEASELQDFLAAAYPQVEHISVETAYGGEPRVLVRVRETGLRRGVEVWELSDGMLRFLLLCTALLNPVAPGFIAVDEPEAGLHPKLLPIIADLIRSASQRTQVLVTTHSPQLLNSFDLDHIAVMTREEAHAAWYRPASRDSLRKMLESQLGGTLGELHASGELEALS
ncbi:MAG: AAA family ATPase [Planctomycetota bacterium]